MPPLREMWLDCAFRQTPDAFFAELEAQEHRRYTKSHVARDGVPYLPNVTYIVVGRDVRDVFVMLWNHYLTMNELDYIGHMNAIPNRAGPPLPEPPGGVRNAWRRDVLSDDDLALYDRRAAEVLDPACRAWLEDLDGRRSPHP